MRLTTQQAAKYVPIAGQAVSAALTFSSLKLVCEQHIQQCVAVSRQLMLPHGAGAADSATRADSHGPAEAAKPQGRMPSFGA